MSPAKPGPRHRADRSTNEGLAADLRGNLNLAHRLAPIYGLRFPVRGEDWHIELGPGHSYFKAGAWRTGNEMAQLHAGEMVLPARIAGAVRSALAGGSGAGAAPMIGNVNVYANTEAEGRAGAKGFVEVLARRRCRHRRQDRLTVPNFNPSFPEVLGNEWLINVGLTSRVWAGAPAAMARLQSTTAETILLLGTSATVNPLLRESIPTVVDVIEEGNEETALFQTANLVPNQDIVSGGWRTRAGGTTNLYTIIDSPTIRWPNTAISSNWIQNGLANEDPYECHFDAAAFDAGGAQQNARIGFVAVQAILGANTGFRKLRVGLDIGGVGYPPAGGSVRDVSRYGSIQVFWYGEINPATGKPWTSRRHRRLQDRGHLEATHPDGRHHRPPISGGVGGVAQRLLPDDGEPGGGRGVASPRSPDLEAHQCRHRLAHARPFRCRQLVEALRPQLPVLLAPVGVPHRSTGPWSPTMSAGTRSAKTWDPTASPPAGARHPVAYSRRWGHRMTCSDGPPTGSPRSSIRR